MSEHEHEPERDPDWIAPTMPDPGEDGEAAEDDEPEAEAEAEPVAQGLTPEEVEKRYAKAERATVAYAKRIGEALGDLADDLTPCPLCPDVHKGFVNVSDAGRVPDPVKDVVMLYLGFATEAEYVPSPSHHVCTACEGLGKVKSGSRVAQWEALTCPACKGYGFVPPPGAENVVDVSGATVLPLHGPDSPAGGGTDRDPSGEPRLLPDGRENPNFGKWPQFKVSVPPWGSTAGLVAQDAG
jgi:hypothetical protein